MRVAELKKNFLSTFECVAISVRPVVMPIHLRLQQVGAMCLRLAVLLHVIAQRIYGNLQQSGSVSVTLRFTVTKRLDGHVTSHG